MRDMRDMQPLLSELSARHAHLCPRQILGLRIGLAGAARLGLGLPRRDKMLMVIAESDGCFADGLEVAAGVSIGHRTLRVEDYGKVAATFINAQTGAALRLAPRPDIRQTAFAYAAGETRRYYAQVEGYQRMPDEELLSVRSVSLTASIAQIIGQAGTRVNCSVCGEEIINQREITIGGQPFCPACLGRGYYQPIAEAAILATQPVSRPSRTWRQAPAEFLGRMAG